MMLSIVSSLLLVLSLTIIAGEGPVVRPYKGHLFLDPADLKSDEEDKLPKANTFQQKVNHFSVQDPDKFAQRFYINDNFWKRDNGPVFILIGGESPITPYDVVKGHHVEMAKSNNALVIALEHRFYGKSMPKADLSTASLNLLSAEQALSDLARFIDHIREIFDIKKENTLITFGGSYPGSLSAWFRMKYPSLVYAAVASSAPVMAQVDFSGYMRVVGESFADKNIGGSDLCLANIKRAFAQVEAIGTSPNGLVTIAEKFHSCSALNGDEDFTFLLQTLAMEFEGAVQYNSQAPLSVKQICQMMVEIDKTPIEHLYVINDALLTKSKKQCNSFSYRGMIKALTAATPEDQSGDLQWIYQTCSQLGYYQFCDPAQGCPFSARMDLDNNIKICADLFGIKKEMIFESIRSTNNIYGGLRPGADRILFVNGDIDPWHRLSVLLKNHVLGHGAIYIKGASHCQDMKPSSEADTPEMKSARTNIEAVVENWISEARKEHKHAVQ